MSFARRRLHFSCLQGSSIGEIRTLTLSENALGPDAHLHILPEGISTLPGKRFGLKDRTHCVVQNNRGSQGVPSQRLSRLIDSQGDIRFFRSVVKEEVGDRSATG